MVILSNVVIIIVYLMEKILGNFFQRISLLLLAVNFTFNYLHVYQYSLSHLYNYFSFHSINVGKKNHSSLGISMSEIIAQIDKWSLFRSF